MNEVTVKTTLTVLFFSLIFLSCSDPTNPFFQETDFTTVPPPMDFSDTERFETDSGVGYYILEEGDGEFTLQYRDGMRVFFTLRTEDGEIIQSTYANGRETPEERGVQSFNTQGARDGVLGMKAGETRVVVVPPDQGFANVSQNNQYYEFRNDTLIYEVELIEILD